jgi:hypothetical protein
MTMPGTQDRSTQKLSYTIREDWKFYLFALLPYFLVIFALWILLDEGFFAQLYSLDIIWALPLILFQTISVIPYDHYFLLGLGVLLLGMTAIWVVILFVQRKPRIDKAAPKGSFLAFIDRSRGWIRGKYPLRALSGLGLILLAIGLIFAVTTFILLQQMIVDQALFFHQWSDIAIIAAMVVTFILIVCERGEE